MRQNSTTQEKDYESPIKPQKINHFKAITGESYSYSFKKIILEPHTFL